MSLSATFKGKKVLVTGGGAGLGRSIVKKLYDDGATIFTLEKDESLVEALKSDFPGITAVKVDVSDFENTNKIVEGFGPLDHLVNNAAVMIPQNFLDITLESLNLLFDVNFKATLVIGQVVAKGMIEKKSGGSIVNISSVAGKKALPTMTGYSCTKAALSTLTRHMAVELGEHNIRVNCVSPTMMDTPFVKAATQEAIDATLAKHVLKRIVDPNEAADLVLFLLSPLSAMITGDDILIDAGFCCH